MNRRHHHHQQRPADSLQLTMSDSARQGECSREEKRARATAYLTSWIEQNSFMIDIPKINTDVDDDDVSRLSGYEEVFAAFSDKDVEEDDIPNNNNRSLYQQQEQDQQAKSFHALASGLNAPRCQVRSLTGRAGEDTYLRHLDLGDVGSPEDMLHDTPSNSTNGETHHLPDEINSLRVHDFVFIQRSDGRWTYAIIAERKEDTIRLVVDTKGCTKSLTKRNWQSSIRLVDPEACKRSWMTKGGVSNKNDEEKKEEEEERIWTPAKRSTST